MIAGAIATLLALGTASAGVPVPSTNQLKALDIGISQFLCYNIDPFANPHVEHNCVSGPPCLNASLFNPTNQSTDNWVSTAKAMGATELILTAHHEGGFCLWPSAYSNYTVAQSPWGKGGGDIVADYVASCRKAGVDPGFYWGPNANGDLTWRGFNAEQFIELQLGQLRELLAYKPSRLWWDHYSQGKEGDGRLSPCPKDSFPQGWSQFIEEVRRLSPSTIICPGPDCTGHLGEGGTGAYPVYYTCTPVPCVGNASMDCGCAISTHKPGAPAFKPLETCSTPYVHHQWFAAGTGNGQIQWSVLDFWNSWRTSVGIGYINTMNSAPGTTGQTQPGLISVQRAFGKVLEPLQLSSALPGALVSTAYMPPEPHAPSARVVDSMSGPCATLEQIVDLGSTQSVGAVVIREDLTAGQRIVQYAVDYADSQGDWHEIVNCSSGGGGGNNKTFEIRHNANNVFGEPPPAGNTSTITYVGKFDTYEPCQAACLAEDTCHSFTWVGASGDEYANMCYIRNNTFWSPHTESPDISGYKGLPPHPLNGQCVHAQTVGALLVDDIPRTTTNKIRFRCVQSLQDPVSIRSLSAHEFTPPSQ